MSFPRLTTSSLSGSFCFSSQVLSCQPSVHSNPPQSPDYQCPRQASSEGLSCFVSGHSPFSRVAPQGTREAPPSPTKSKARPTQTERASARCRVRAKALPPSIRSGWATGEASPLVLEDWGDCGRGFIYIYKESERRKRKLRENVGQRRKTSDTGQTKTKPSKDRERKRSGRGRVRKKRADEDAEEENDRKAGEAQQHDASGEEEDNRTRISAQTAQDEAPCPVGNNSDGKNACPERAEASSGLPQQHDAFDFDLDEDIMAAFEPGTKIWLDWEAVLDNGMINHSVARPLCTPVCTYRDSCSYRYAPDRGSFFSRSSSAPRQVLTSVSLFLNGRIRGQAQRRNQ